MAPVSTLPDNIAEFLGQRTPDAWVEEACRRLPELLLDHAKSTVIRSARH
jgi:tRNA isopentenyl-2-thiomethyl-A-37 hydroxylase MiaE